MTVDDVTNYYTNAYRFSKHTGMSWATFTNWKKYGFVPPLMQLRLEHITGGKLKADLTELKRSWDEHSELNKTNKSRNNSRTGQGQELR